jgi:hypothetical protein
MKNYARLSLIAVSALVVLVAVSMYSARISTAVDRESPTAAAPVNVPDSADIFEANHTYDLAISDAGERRVYRCRVLQTRSNWVFCQATWKLSNGTTASGNMWLNADNMAAVRIVQ